LWRGNTAAPHNQRIQKMAIISNLTQVERRKSSNDHTSCHAEFSVTEHGVLIRTFGSAKRDYPAKSSQVMHITRHQLEIMLEASKRDAP
jgi:hypothetical protein